MGEFLQHMIALLFIGIMMFFVVGIIVCLAYLLGALVMYMFGGVVCG